MVAARPRRGGPTPATAAGNALIACRVEAMPPGQISTVKAGTCAGTTPAPRRRALVSATGTSRHDRDSSTRPHHRRWSRRDYRDPCTGVRPTEHSRGLALRLQARRRAGGRRLWSRSRRFRPTPADSPPPAAPRRTHTHASSEASAGRWWSDRTGRSRQHRRVLRCRWCQDRHLVAPDRYREGDPRVLVGPDRFPAGDPGEIVALDRYREGDPGVLVALDRLPAGDPGLRVAIRVLPTSHRIDTSGQFTRSGSGSRATHLPGRSGRKGTRGYRVAGGALAEGHRRLRGCPGSPSGRLSGATNQAGQAGRKGSRGYRVSERRQAEGDPRLRGSRPMPPGRHPGATALAADA